MCVESSRTFVACRKRSITRPRDHVTVRPLFHAIISLSICPNDARPIGSLAYFSPPHPPPNLSSPPSSALAVRYVFVCVTYLHNAPIVFAHARIIQPLLYTWTRAYSLTCARIHTLTRSLLYLEARIPYTYIACRAKSMRE